jgi:hypothetical protein
VPAIQAAADAAKVASEAGATTEALADVAQQITNLDTIVDDIHDTDLVAIAGQITAEKAVIDDIHNTDLPATYSVANAAKVAAQAGATATGLSAVSTKVDNVKSVVDAIRATDVVSIASAIGVVDDVVDAIRETDVPAIQSAADAAKVASEAGATGTALADVAQQITDLDAIVDDIHDTDLVAIAGQITEAKVVIDDIHDTDLPDVISAAEAAQTAAEASTVAITGLNNVSVLDVVEGVFEAIVDGAITVEDVFVRLNAFVAGDSEKEGTDPVVVTFFKENGTTPAITQTFEASGASRTAE